MARNGFLIHMILLLEKMRVPFFGRVKFVHLKRTPFFIRYFPNKPMTVWVEFQMNLSAFLELPLVTNDSLPKKNNITRRF